MEVYSTVFTIAVPIDIDLSDIGVNYDAGKAFNELHLSDVM